MFSLPLRSYGQNNQGKQCKVGREISGPTASVGSLLFGTMCWDKAPWLEECGHHKQEGTRNNIPCQGCPPPRDFFQPDTNPYNLHNFLQRAPPAGNWLYDTQDCGGPYKIQSFIEKMERGFRGRDPFTRLSGCEGLGEGRGSDAWDHLV